jgi:hypothetical protein
MACSAGSPAATHVELQVPALDRERVQAAVFAPGGEHGQVRSRVLPGDTFEPGQVRRHGRWQQVRPGWLAAGDRGDGDAHSSTMRPRPALMSSSGHVGKPARAKIRTFTVVVIGIGRIERVWL